MMKARKSGTNRERMQSSPCQGSEGSRSTLVRSVPSPWQQPCPQDPCSQHPQEVSMKNCHDSFKVKLFHHHDIVEYWYFLNADKRQIIHFNYLYPSKCLPLQRKKRFSVCTLSPREVLSWRLCNPCLWSFTSRQARERQTQKVPSPRAVQSPHPDPSCHYPRLQWTDYHDGTCTGV